MFKFTDDLDIRTWCELGIHNDSVRYLVLQALFVSLKDTQSIWFACSAYNYCVNSMFSDRITFDTMLWVFYMCKIDCSWLSICITFFFVDISIYADDIILLPLSPMN